MENLAAGRLVFLEFLGYTEKYTTIFPAKNHRFFRRGFYETTIFRQAFMRFHIMHKKINQTAEEYRVFFETDSIDEAKDFAMRLAFDETNNVYVQDTKRDEIVRDFDALVYRV